MIGIYRDILTMVRKEVVQCHSSLCGNSPLVVPAYSCQNLSDDSLAPRSRLQSLKTCRGYRIPQCIMSCQCVKHKNGRKIHI